MDETKRQKRLRRRFTDEFKSGAVRLVIDEGKTVMQVARDLDLTASALRQWVERARADRGKGTLCVLQVDVPKHYYRVCAALDPIATEAVDRDVCLSGLRRKEVSCADSIQRCPGMLLRSRVAVPDPSL